MTGFWIGSWKMNKALAEARVFAQGLAVADVRRDPCIQRLVIPPFTVCPEVKAMLEGTSVRVAARNMHRDDACVRTGEDSPRC